MTMMMDTAKTLPSIQRRNQSPPWPSSQSPRRNSMIQESHEKSHLDHGCYLRFRAEKAGCAGPMVALGRDFAHAEMQNGALALAGGVGPNNQALCGSLESSDLDTKFGAANGLPSTYIGVYSDLAATPFRLFDDGQRGSFTISTVKKIHFLPSSIFPEFNRGWPTGFLPIFRYKRIHPAPSSDLPTRPFGIAAKAVPSLSLIRKPTARRDHPHSFGRAGVAKVVPFALSLIGQRCSLEQHTTTRYDFLVPFETSAVANIVPEPTSSFSQEPVSRCAMTTIPNLCVANVVPELQLLYQGFIPRRATSPSTRIPIRIWSANGVP